MNFPYLSLLVGDSNILFKFFVIVSISLIIIFFFRECDEKDHFLCTNSKCIPKKWRCDGISDCLDHTANKSSSDEIGCGKS